MDPHYAGCGFEVQGPEGHSHQPQPINGVFSRAGFASGVLRRTGHLEATGLGCQLPVSLDQPAQSDPPMSRKGRENLGCDAVKPPELFGDCLGGKQHAPPRAEKFGVSLHLINILQRDDLGLDIRNYEATASRPSNETCDVGSSLPEEMENDLAALQYVT